MTLFLKNAKEVLKEVRNKCVQSLLEVLTKFVRSSFKVCKKLVRSLYKVRNKFLNTNPSKNFFAQTQERLRDEALPRHLSEGLFRRSTSTLP